ncbi:hypothetical protein ACWDV7_26075 [Streptomyces sp. NPDC003362]
MERRGTGGLPAHHADLVTRQLCAHCYRDHKFAEDVMRTFVRQRLVAHGQPMGVDLVAVVRHARRAHRLHQLRDALLVVCCLVVAAGVTGTLAALIEWDEQRERALDLLRLTGWALLAAAVLVYAWGWVLWSAAEAVHWGKAPPRDGAAPAPLPLEAELDALDEANAVSYTVTGQEAENPFVGSGINVVQRVWAGIDVGRPAEDAEVKPFTAAELHAYVAERAADLAGLDGLRARDRLYVQGHHVRDVGPALLPNPLYRPMTRIDPALVEAGTAASDAVMRTYLSLESVGVSGSHVITVYVRARLFRSRLSWEVSAFYLPPLDAEYTGRFKRPIGPVERAVRLLGHTVARFASHLLGAPGRVIRRVWHRVGDHVLQLIARGRIVRRSAHFDYGTVGTLRETVSDIQRYKDHTQLMDAQDAFQRLQQAVLLATEQFLKDHGIDASDLKQAHKTINNQTYNFNGPVTGRQNIFGNNGINFAGPGGPGREDGGQRWASTTSTGPSTASSSTSATAEPTTKS